MAYNSKLASYLSGATKSQLDRWAATGVLQPELSSNPREYSFRDLVALRTIAKLRAHVSLQKIRRALDSLRDQELTEHLSEYRFATDGKSVKVWTEDGFMDLVENPGQWELRTLEDIYAPFQNWKNQLVPPLREPSKGIEIDPLKLHGTPVIVGTRVPFDAVVNLCTGEDAMDADEVTEAYPTLGFEAVTDALGFQNTIDEWTA